MAEFPPVIGLGPPVIEHISPVIEYISPVIELVEIHPAPQKGQSWL